ncbi:MAG: polymerase primary sigma factor [Fusobacteriaceae bacterium]|jgi:RNA polymerase primary sigma factor|nr:polymerase primary sigma factor [Fusobacteriaceae bacterium]
MNIFNFKINNIFNKDKESELFNKYKNGDDSVKEDIIKHSLNMVLKIAHSKKNYGLDLEDLVQEGIMGVIHAIEKFDITKNIRFSTYAYPWINHYINNAINTTSKQIRLPQNLLLLSEKIKKLQEEYQNNLSLENIAEKLSLSLDKVKSLLNYQEYSFLSLEQNINDFFNSKFENAIEDIKSSKIFNKIDVLDQISDMLSKLNDKEAEIIKLRYFKEETLKKISEQFGITKEAVRQIEKRAIEKLRTIYFNENITI